MSEERVRGSSQGRVLDVFLTFLKLGLTSFGGPTAHIGYFRTELVERRSWISDEQFAQLLAICQVIPGPASSQLGFCLGMQRAGWTGAIAAFLAFTLPSVILLILFAQSLTLFSGSQGLAIIHGLKLVACAVVADALLGMAKNLCPDWPRKIIAFVAASTLLIVSLASAQVIVIALAAGAGVFVLGNSVTASESDKINIGYGSRLGGCFVFLFFALLVVLPVMASGRPDIPSIADAFYQAGALVFGGGHVVLPLLEDAVVSPGWMTSDEFLAGYGASQAIPGPMFAFSAYLGAMISGSHSVYLYATTALIFMFLPGFLLVIGVLPFWRAISHNTWANRAIAGVNAAVAGLLAAALWDPIITSGISSFVDVIIVLTAFLALVRWRVSPLLVVCWCILARVLFTLF